MLDHNKIEAVFITGAPRSGTTMLASVLASRNDTIAINEMHYIHELLKEQRIKGSVPENKQLRKLKNNNFIKQLDIVDNPIELKKLIREDFRDTVFNILNTAKEKYYPDKEIKYWVEHTPHNHHYDITLRDQFPNSKFVHIIRDGRAVYSSTKQMPWGLKDVVSGAISWRRQVSHCMELDSKDFFYTVRYKDFVLDPENELKKICDFLGWDFRETMLNAEGLYFNKSTRKNHSDLLGKRPNSSSLNKWKDQLSDLEIKYFNYYNKDLLEYFDYKIDKAKNLNPLIKYPLWIKGLTEFVLRKIYREVKNII